jgi:hypothetical protein
VHITYGCIKLEYSSTVNIVSVFPHVLALPLRVVVRVEEVLGGHRGGFDAQILQQAAVVLVVPGREGGRRYV